jgi:hypothetical protein
MRKVGLIVGLLLCASYQGSAEAKKREPPTRSQALADCGSRVPGFGECYKLHDGHTYSQCANQIQNCLQFLKTAEAAFKTGHWHPSQGPWANCGGRRAGSPYGRSYTIQCSYLSNIDKDAEYRATAEAARKAEAKREERTQRERCERKWPDYVGSIKQAFDTAPEHEVYGLPEMRVIDPRHVQAYFDQALVRATKVLEQPANAENELGTYWRLAYLLQLGTDENRPGPCRMYTLDSTGLTPEIAVWREKLAAQATALLEVRAAEIRRQEDEIRRQQEREKKLDEAHDRKVFAAIRRAGAKADTYYWGLAENVIEEGMSKVRGRAVFLDAADGGFGLLQVLSGGKALFDGGYPFTVMVVGIKTANLMHETALTHIGVHWVKVLGFVNYTNPMGGQAQAVKVKPLRKIPHPERGQKLE